MHHVHAITPIILVFDESHPGKRVNHIITLTAGVPLNSKIQVYAHNILKCLHAMETIKFMYVCINLLTIK